MAEWINPNDVADADIKETAASVASTTDATTKIDPSEWLARMISDAREAFAAFSKIGFNPIGLLTGNVSLRSTLSNVFKIAAGAARNAALSNAKSTWEKTVNADAAANGTYIDTSKGLPWQQNVAIAEAAAGDGINIDTTSIPNFNATPAAISAAEAGELLDAFKTATGVMLALKNGNIEPFANVLINSAMAAAKSEAIADAKIAYELDLIDNPDLDATLGSYYVSTPLTQKVSLSSPNGSSITQALTTPKQTVTANIAGAGFSVRPVNMTEVSLSSPITLKQTPSVVSSVTGLTSGIVDGKPVILVYPISPAALVSDVTEKITKDTYTISGKTVSVTQKLTQYSSIIVRYRTHSSYNPNVKTA